MKISEVKTFVVGNPWKNWVLVKVETDEGLYGWGDATQGLATQPVVGAIRELRRFYDGRDPLLIEGLWDEMFKGLYLTANGTLLSAMAAIETACWDILGKALGVPLHQLFGGKVRDRIRAYANGWYNGPRDPGFLAEKAAEVVSLGYGALKFDPFGSGYQVLDADERRRCLDLVAAVRQAIGDQADLIIEVHDRLTVPEAVAISRSLEEFAPLWIEAPVWSEDVAALAAVATRSHIRVGAGERFTSLRPFADLLATGHVDLLLPEYVELGGIHRLRQVAALAESYQAVLAPHNARCMLSTAVNVQVGAATRNLLIQETFDDFQVPWARDLFDGLPQIFDGYLEVGDAPGHGIAVNEELIAQHPYADTNFMHFFQDGWERRFSP